MKRLYNRFEEIRYLHIVIAVLEILLIIVCIYVYGINRIFFNSILYTFILFCVLEVIVFCIWYPKEYETKNAINKGKEYKGKVISIYTKEKKTYGPYSSKIAYAIKVWYCIDGKPYSVEFGDYSRSPFEYIKVYEKCNVYIYKDKIYPQFFYKKQEAHIEKEQKKEQDKVLWEVLSGKLDNAPLEKILKYSIKDIECLKGDELQNAVSERMDLCMVNSKSYIILNPEYFRYLDKPLELKMIFAEVYMTSKKKYSSNDFEFTKKLWEYCRFAENKFYHYEEDIVCSEIKKLIFDAISEKDKRIIINEICIVIRDGF